MSLTKKHFKAIAKILREHIRADLENATPETCEAIKIRSNDLISEFMIFCRAENGLFNSDKFKDAILGEEK